ncbi:zinc knuckle, partial [Colletotrichum simmondsii]
YEHFYPSLLFVFLLGHSRLIDAIQFLVTLVAVTLPTLLLISPSGPEPKLYVDPRAKTRPSSAMADHAPGMGPSMKEPSCINCGGVGHWAVACPEPVRAKPAGLSRKNTSSGHDHHGRGGEYQHGGRRPGAVVTKYSAPPSGNPIVTRYAPPPGQPHAPPYPGPLPSYPSYPPPPNGYPPPPTGNYPGYSQYSPPPPPPPGAHPPPPAPPAPYHYPPSGQYGAPPPPGPSGLPPPPYQPPPPQYAGSAPYPLPPPPPSYSSSPGYHPGPPPSGGQYPPSYNSTPPGGYPQPHYGSQPPPTPSTYPPSWAPPPPGYGHPPPLPGPPRATPPGLPPIPPARNQPPRDRNGRHRQGHNNRDRSRRNKQGNQSKRDPSQPRPKSENKARPGPTLPQLEAGSKVAVEAPSVASDTPKSVNINSASEQEADEEYDWNWEEEMIFKELEKTHQPDPIAKPLPGPEEYHDNIVLPPAWNATWIQSRFATEGNLTEFSRPIRETEFFVTLQYDPAFWKCPEGSAPKQPPEPRERPSTFKSSRLPGFPSLPPKPPTPENREYRLVNNRKRTLDDSTYKSSRVRGVPEGGEWADHRHKRHKVDSLPGYNATSPHNPRSREDSRPTDRYRHQRPERTDSDPGQTLLMSLDESQDAGPSRRFEDAGLQDSGYYSSRNVRRQTSTNNFQERGASPPMLHRGTSRPDSRPHSRQASRSRSRSRHSRRRGSHSSHDESRPASRQSVASFGSDASELSALEAELLGIAPKSKADRDGKPDGVKMRKRVTKVDSAYR